MTRHPPASKLLSATERDRVVIRLVKVSVCVGSEEAGLALFMGLMDRAAKQTLHFSTDRLAGAIYSKDRIRLLHRVRWSRVVRLGFGRRDVGLRCRLNLVVSMGFGFVLSSLPASVPCASFVLCLDHLSYQKS